MVLTGALAGETVARRVYEYTFKKNGNDYVNVKAILTPAPPAAVSSPTVTVQVAEKVPFRAVMVAVDQQESLCGHRVQRHRGPGFHQLSESGHHHHHRRSWRRRRSERSRSAAGPPPG